ncbi:hypothetical protein M011DRAFT_473879 [Sporormia fimetaria CBS 119925]|uniref:YDG domain-containing protein n=1 Tax=Sporormia fimetaria CBS 119925 TaxID=1340428 RepID=A0A6A6VML1_9PLEO|nr:hypothetical protein M011DRAFT_473879 [Sporormia fimetaria CBS 119925]
MGGIYGEKGKGVCSVVAAASSKYEDVDNGDVLEYTGTDSTDSDMTENTQRLHEFWRNYNHGVPNPVRVIRSNRDQIKVTDKHPWPPVCGFRYDGLYDVGGELRDASRGVWRFTLKRRPGQVAIRNGNYQQDKRARPTLHEQNANEVEVAKKKADKGAQKMIEKEKAREKASASGPGNRRKSVAGTAAASAKAKGNGAVDGEQSRNGNANGSGKGKAKGSRKGKEPVRD